MIVPTSRATRTARQAHPGHRRSAGRCGRPIVPRPGIHLGLALGLILLIGPACNIETYLNRTESLGGDTAGVRGTVDVVIINNTDARAILTAGTYDDLDQFTIPDAELFGADAAQQRLEAGGDTGVMTLNCARVFSIGGAGLIEAIENNDASFPDGLDQPALVPGVYFSSSSLDSLNAALPTAGVAPPLEVNLGIDFSCGSLLIVRLEIDDAGPDEFRVDFEIIPP